MPSKNEIRPTIKNGIVSTIQSLIKYTLKLLDSSDAADKTIFKIFSSFESKLISYERICRSLHREKKSALAALEHAETRCRQFSEEAQRLQRQLDVIREVLSENDIDRAKLRLAQLDMDVIPHSRRLTGGGRTDHSAGSLLDPGNASSGSDTEGNSLVMPQTSASSKRKSSVNTPKCRKRSRPEHTILRRSLRLSSNRQSISFLGVKSEHQRAVEAHQKNLKTNPTSSAIFERRMSTDSGDSYQDVFFKHTAIVGPGPLCTDGESDTGFYTPRVGPTSSTEEISSLTSSNTLGPNTLVKMLPSEVTTPTSKRSRIVRTPATESRLTRVHKFISRSALSFELCSYCGKRITFGKPLKCSVCQLIVHPSCRPQLKQRCVPVSELTPSPGVGGISSTKRMTRTPATRGNMTNHRVDYFASPLSIQRERLWGSVKLSSMCPINEFPQVPAIVIHCVTEVAARGLLEVGIYRICGAKKQVTDLYEKLMHGRSTPSLALIEDIHVVCSCLKMFLRALDEPLVTFTLRKEFIAAATMASTNPDAAKYQIATILNKLPSCYRDTFAYLLLHLKDVSRSPACQMGEENLAKIFGPTIVGYPCHNPPPMEASNEVIVQQAVVRLLLSLPDVVYSSVLSPGSLVPRSSAESSNFRSITHFEPIRLSSYLSNDSKDTDTTNQAFPVDRTRTWRAAQTLPKNEATVSKRRFFPSILSRNANGT